MKIRTRMRLIFLIALTRALTFLFAR